MSVSPHDSQKLTPSTTQPAKNSHTSPSRLSALRDATQRGAGEALWFNVHNYLQSGSISNIFIVKDRTLLTPPTRDDLLDPVIAEKIPYAKSATLPGITRQVIFELAAIEKIAIEHAAITINQLLDADEAFLTNSIMAIMPISRIERSPIGHDKPGPITRRLSELYQQQISGA